MRLEIERSLVWPEKKTSATVDPEKQQIMTSPKRNTPAPARPNGTPQRRLRAQQADQIEKRVYRIWPIGNNFWLPHHRPEVRLPLTVDVVGAHAFLHQWKDLR